jgi:hypothetical protein
MSSTEVTLHNLDRAPSWPLLRMEFSLLLADLRDDPKYSDRVKRFGELLADPRFPAIEQIYFVHK